jgi:hypothetical protein
LAPGEAGAVDRQAPAGSVEDEGVFTTPWTGTVTYGRGSDEWPETVCAENIKKYYEPDTDVPTATKARF